MVLLPVANINEQRKACAKRGVPVPSEEEMVNAARELCFVASKKRGRISRKTSSPSP